MSVVFGMIVAKLRRKSPPPAKLVSGPIGCSAFMPGEHFGDFAIRAGYVVEVKEGRFFND